ncbi:MAG: mismatch repair protein MutS [Planctomycetota bacterium]|jgi:hypothetical protein
MEAAVQRHSQEVQPVIRPEAAYQTRLEEIRAEMLVYQQRDRGFVHIRTGLGIVTLLLVILCLGEPERVSWLWLMVPILIFLAVLPFDRRCVRTLQRLTLLQRFYESRLNRLHRIFAAGLPDGREFTSENHPWTQDLDVFGQGSLFQMLNECRTQPGRQRLATWLTTVPDAEEILLRQSRAQGLKQALLLRESLACIPEVENWSAAEDLLKRWVREPAQPIPVGVLIWATTLGIAAVPLMALLLMDLISLSWLVAMVILQAPAILLTRRQISQTAAVMDRVDQALKQFGAVIAVFEQQPVEEPAVRDLLNHFHTETETASRAIQRLSRLTQWMNNSMRNQFFAPIAWTCGLFVILTHRMESWRRQFGIDVADWLETVACLEATVSIAGYCFDHPEDCLPEIVSDRAELLADDLGHPLLKGSVCVRNSLHLTAETPLMLISGSNMSGKSTFLRSIGASIVLTFCGSVVRARRFVTYPFQLGTAMRVSDSLQEGRSLFFSVVQRLKSVVDLTSGDRTVLFLLDEILHGTNSHDRRRGAEAVIRSLVERNALGLVTTHDLALTRIADSMPNQAVNKHFEDTIVEGTMLFDYTLRDGVVERSNAIELMRMLGLNV